MVETKAPPVLLLSPELEKAQHPHHHHKHAKEYHLRGDFLVHCHVEMHMMMGLAALVRSQQTVWLTPAEADELERHDRIAARSRQQQLSGGAVGPLSNCR